MGIITSKFEIASSSTEIQRAKAFRKEQKHTNEIPAE